MHNRDGNQPSLLLFRYWSVCSRCHCSSGDFLSPVVVILCRIPLCLPFGKFPLSFLTFVKGENVRQKDSCNVFNLVLWDAAVIDELLSPAQGTPPSNLSAVLVPSTAEGRCLECLSCLFFTSSFRFENENADVRQAIGLTASASVSYVSVMIFYCEYENLSRCSE